MYEPRQTAAELQPNTHTAAELVDHRVNTHFKVLDECCRYTCYHSGANNA